MLTGDSALLDRAFTNAERSGAKAATGLELAGRRISTAGTKISSAGKAITKYGSLPVAALGAVAIKTAMDFEKGMRNVNSIAQLPEKQFRKLNREVLAMSGEMAQAPKTMAEGMYDLVSSGFDANESLVVLRASAKAATAGLTTTEVSSKAVAAALNAYHRPAKNAGQVSDDLFETVNRGVVSFEELAGAIGYVLPAAATMGINIKEVGASISTLTKEGQSGETAITNINQAITAFIKPSKALSGTIKDLGYASGEQIIQQKGFQGALEAVTRAAHGNKEEIGHMFSNVRAMRAVFGLTGKSAASAREDVAAFNKDAGRTNQVLAEQKKSTAYQWKQLRSEAEVLAITMGKDLIPIVREVGTDVKDVVESFMGMPKGTQKTIVEFGLVTVAAGPLIRTFGALTTGIGKTIELAGSLQKAEIGSSIARAIGGNVADGKGTYELARSFGRGRLASSAAGFFSTSFAKYLGVGLAAVGIGNIAISATEGDWKDAGFKAGGALVGGIAGAFLGPEGAMIGAGAGSILGGVIGNLFSSEKRLTPLQQRLREESDHAAQAFKRQRDAAKGLVDAEDALRSSNQRHKRSTESVTQAHRELNTAVRKFGPNSLQAHAAELELAKAQHRDAKTAEEAKEAHKLAGNQLKLYRHQTTEAVASEKQRLPNLEAIVDHLQKRSSREKGNIPLLERTVEKEEQLAKVNHRLNNLISEAAQVGGPKYARMLRNMSAEQAEFGTHYRGLLKQIPEFGKKTETSTQKAERAFGHWTDVFSQQAGRGKSAVRSFDRATVTGMADVVSRLNETMTVLTGKQVEFSVGKQRGGTISEGTPSGDSVPALLERGEYVLNRNAVKAIGTSALDAINFAAAPRFQKGGPLGREPRLTGTEPLRGAGQHAIHDVFRAATKYYDRHDGIGRIIANGNRMDALQQPYLWGGGHGASASRNGPWDCSGGISELFDGSGLPGSGFNFAPMVSGGFESWGLPGKGDVSVLANADHVYAVVKGRGAIGTSGENPGGGFGWISGYTFRPGFTIRHADLSGAGKGGRGSGRRGKGQKQKRGFQKGGSVTGKVSYFGGGATSGGSNTSRPGVALNLNPGTESGWDNPTTQRWMEESRAGHPVYAKVTIAGHSALLPITERGPAGWTGRAIDVTEGGVSKLGLSTSNFPTDSVGTAIIGGGGSSESAKKRKEKEREQIKEYAIGAGHAIWASPLKPTALPKFAKGLSKSIREQLRAPGITYGGKVGVSELALSQAEDEYGQAQSHAETLRSQGQKLAESGNQSGAERKYAEAEKAERPAKRGEEAVLGYQQKLFERRQKQLKAKLHQVEKQLTMVHDPAKQKQLLNKAQHLREELGTVQGQLSGVRSTRSSLNESVEGLEFDQEAKEQAARERPRNEAELELARAEATKNNKSDDLKALEDLRKVAEEELHRAEASGDLNSITEATQNLTQATENLRNLAIETFEEQTEGELALAELTEGLEDDLSILHRKLSFAEEHLAEAQAEDNWAEISRWAHEVKGLTEAIKSDESSESRAQVAEEMKSLREAIEQQTKIAESVAATSAATAIKALADIISGHLGPKAILQAQTAGNGSVGTF